MIEAISLRIERPLISEGAIEILGSFLKVTSVRIRKISMKLVFFLLLALPSQTRIFNSGKDPNSVEAKIQAFLDAKPDPPTPNVIVVIDKSLKSAPSQRKTSQRTPKRKAKDHSTPQRLNTSTPQRLNPYALYPPVPRMTPVQFVQGQPGLPFPPMVVQGPHFHPPVTVRVNELPRSSESSGSSGLNPVQLRRLGLSRQKEKLSAVKRNLDDLLAEFQAMQSDLQMKLDDQVSRLNLIS